MFDLVAACAQFLALFGELLALRGELGFESGQLCLLLSCSLALLPQFHLQLDGQRLQGTVVQLVEIGKRVRHHALNMP